MTATLLAMSSGSPSLELLQSCGRMEAEIEAFGPGDEQEAYAVWQALLWIEKQVTACRTKAGEKVNELGAAEARRMS